MNLLKLYNEARPGRVELKPVEDKSVGIQYDIRRSAKSPYVIWSTKMNAAHGREVSLEKAKKWRDRYAPEATIMVRTDHKD
jgi:hypothetical protein